MHADDDALERNEDLKEQIPTRVAVTNIFSEQIYWIL